MPKFYNRAILGLYWYDEMMIFGGYMTVSLGDLWLAIIVSGLLCWVASALIHMLIKYHNADYKKLENEDEVMKALGAKSPIPALYTVPHCSDMKEMQDASMQKKFENGPVAMISVLPNGMPAMGKLLILQVAFFILGSALIAYLASISIMASSEAAIVFRHVFVAAFLAYGWAQIPYSIWMGQPWANCVRYLIDAAIYALVTAFVFSWLWPSV